MNPIVNLHVGLPRRRHNAHLTREAEPGKMAAAKRQRTLEGQLNGKHLQWTSD